LQALTKTRRDLEEQIVALKSQHAALEIEAANHSHETQRAQKELEREKERFDDREADLKEQIEVQKASRLAAEQEVLSKEQILKNTKLDLELELAKTQGL